MKFKLTKEGHVYAEDGNLVIRCSPSKRWNKWDKEHKAINGLSPMEIANLEWKRSKTTMKEFVQKRSKKKWVMP